MGGNPAGDSLSPLSRMYFLVLLLCRVEQRRAAALKGTRETMCFSSQLYRPSASSSANQLRILTEHSSGPRPAPDLEAGVPAAWLMCPHLFLALRVAALQTRLWAPGVGRHVGALEVVAGPGGGVGGAGSGCSRHCGGSGTGVDE